MSHECDRTPENAIVREETGKEFGLIGQLLFSIILAGCLFLLYYWARQGGDINGIVFLGIFWLGFAGANVLEIHDLIRGRIRANRIISQGGPKTGEEYLFLLPRSCAVCGSRDFLVRSYLGAFQISYGEYMPTKRSQSSCINNLQRTDYMRTFKDYKEERLRVYSPFLSKKQSEFISIPDGAFSSPEEHQGSKTSLH